MKRNHFEPVKTALKANSSNTLRALGFTLVLTLGATGVLACSDSSTKNEAPISLLPSPKIGSSTTVPPTAPQKPTESRPSATISIDEEVPVIRPAKPATPVEESRPTEYCVTTLDTTTPNRFDTVPNTNGTDPKPCILETTSTPQSTTLFFTVTSPT